MKIVILIAVRMKSTRLPRKALAIIEDQLLIEHLIDRIKTCKKVDQIVLCTSVHPDDKILTKIAEKKGIKWFRGSEDDVMDRFIKAGKKENADILVRVTGDDVFISPKFIDYAIDNHIKCNADYSITEELPFGVAGEVIAMQALKKAHRHAEDPSSSEYMTWYLDNPEFFKVNKIHVNEKLKRPQYRLTCDTIDDLKLIREIFKRLYSKGSIIRLKDVINLLDKNPDLVKINAHVKEKNVKDKINVRLRKEIDLHKN
jgi:spore coat polysaccharide biosynthesis protein SpsF